MKKEMSCLEFIILLVLDYLLIWIGLEVICFVLLWLDIEIPMTLGIAFPIWIILKIIKIITI